LVEALITGGWHYREILILSATCRAFAAKQLVHRQDVKTVPGEISG
jgi:hypothetical protein